MFERYATLNEWDITLITVYNLVSDGGLFSGNDLRPNRSAYLLFWKIIHAEYLQIKVCLCTFDSRYN